MQKFREPLLLIFEYYFSIIGLRNRCRANKNNFFFRNLNNFYLKNCFKINICIWFVMVLRPRKMSDIYHFYQGVCILFRGCGNKRRWVRNWKRKNKLNIFHSFFYFFYFDTILKEGEGFQGMHCVILIG